MCVYVCIIPKATEIHKPRASFPFYAIGDSFAWTAFTKMGRDSILHCFCIYSSTIALSRAGTAYLPWATNLLTDQGHGLKYLDHSPQYDGAALLEWFFLYRSLIFLTFLICPPFQENVPPLHIICSSPNPSFREST